MLVDHQGQPLPQQPSKIVCVGRNYVAHVHELNNAMPTEPVIFCKPISALQPFSEHISLRRDLGEIHYEAELALVLGQPLSQASEEEAIAAIAHQCLALDLTLRDKQNELKQKAQPWELAKAFDGSCVVTPCLALPLAAEFEFFVNEHRVQLGRLEQMMFPVGQLLSFISHYMSLQPGDLVLTGTPEGVGVLPRRARLTLAMLGHQWQGTCAN